MICPVCRGSGGLHLGGKFSLCKCCKGHGELVPCEKCGGYCQDVLGKVGTLAVRMLKEPRDERGDR